MKIARYSIQDCVSYGVVEDDVVKEIAGTPFEKIELTGQEHALAHVKLLAPVTPCKMLALALNYKSHLGDSKPPERPEPFYKTPTCVVGPDEPRLTRGRRRNEIPAHVSRRESNRPQAADLEMGEVLTDATTKPQHLVQRRADVRGRLVVAEIVVNPPCEVQQRLQPRPSRRE